jgi:hypothetical protein
VNLTVRIVARLSIIDPIAIAHSNAALGAIPPDRVLHEPGKHHRECGIESARIDPFRDCLNNVSAAAAPVACRAVGVGGAEPMQDAGAVQKVVHQRIDDDHAGSNLAPEPHPVGSAKQEGRQGHGQHLVGDAINFAQRRDEGSSHAGQSVRTSRAVRRLQLLVNPADQIAIGNVANEQVQGVGGLVEAAVAQVVSRSGQWLM